MWGCRNNKTYQNIQFYCDSGGADLSRSLKMQFQIFWELKENLSDANSTVHKCVHNALLYSSL